MSYLIQPSTTRYVPAADAHESVRLLRSLGLAEEKKFRSVGGVEVYSQWGIVQCPSLYTALLVSSQYYALRVLSSFGAVDKKPTSRNHYKSG